MAKKSKRIASPKSTGGSGGHFESHVQSSFVVLMMAGGFAPCLPGCLITKIMLQAKWDGYDTDDLVVFTETAKDKMVRRILCQVKETITVGNNKLFEEVITAAWSDFNNPQKFTRNADIIALITGPMSTSDINDVRTILEWTRAGTDASSFIHKVTLTNFSSKSKQAKLDVFRTCLTEAKGSVITDEELFQFLKHFHFLGYDLDIKTGVTLSLIHSLIGIFSPDDSEALWTQIVDEVKWRNSNAGQITLLDIPDNIRSAFIQRPVITIPQDFISTNANNEQEWSESKHPGTLAQINLIGAWHDINLDDQASISSFLNEDSVIWKEKVRDILLENNTHLKLANGRWHIIDREKLWIEIGSRVFDDMVESFRQLTVSVLTEIDPKYELEPERRIAADIIGKKLKHSHEIRKGLAETLALLANKPTALPNLSTYRAEGIAIVAVREILNNGNWQLWASLGRLLTTLAEAAPNEFLTAVEKALLQDPCPFDELFAQEGDGFFVGDYMSNILWALEILAWDEEYFVRSSSVLAWLDMHDPGGKSSNRPINSLSTIFLPWYPQTMATFEKRKQAFANLKQEYPEVAWKLVVSLLPNKFQTSMGSAKPVWRNTVDPEWKPAVQRSEYTKEASFYSDAAVSMANGNFDRISLLAKNKENFSEESLLKMVNEMSLENLKLVDESELLELWNSLVSLEKSLSKKDLDESVSYEVIPRLKEIIETIAPKSPANLHLKIFGNHYFPRERKKESWQEREKRITDSRIEALKSIISFGNLNLVIEFAEKVDQPFEVGRALASIANSETDNWLMPKYLDPSQQQHFLMIDGYIKFRFREGQWDWVDQLNMSTWDDDQKAHFLYHLDFVNETWNRVENLLGENEVKYWSIVYPNGFHEKENIGYALDKLVEYDRPGAALKCVYQSEYDSDQIDIDQSIKILLAAAKSKEPSQGTASPYEITIVIKKLQESELSLEQLENLLTIEWIYLRLLDRHSDAQPKSLELKLGLDAVFFTEIIQLTYRSENDKDEQVVISEEKRDISRHAYHLLGEWKTVPGTQTDGNFSATAFETWISSVKTICSESGHWEVASKRIGQSLFYSPADENGLWINRAIAKELNDVKNDSMREGYRSGAFNSRGVHTVDPTGKEEERIAERYESKAVALEEANFHRFAITLRNLAKSYYRDAEDVRQEHSSDVNN